MRWHSACAGDVLGVLAASFFMTRPLKEQIAQTDENLPVRK